jgi:Terpene cyclase DEP1
MTTADQVSSVPFSRKVLCLVYGAIAVASLIATWSQMLAYFDKPAHMLDFWNDTKITPASRMLTADAVLITLSAVILMVIEARRRSVKFVWLYIAGAYATAISVTFPLFLIARELRMGTSEAPRLSTTDTMLLAIVAVSSAVWTIWTDVG